MTWWLRQLDITWPTAQLSPRLGGFQNMPGTGMPRILKEEENGEGIAV